MHTRGRRNIFRRQSFTPRYHIVNMAPCLYLRDRTKAKATIKSWTIPLFELLATTRLLGVSWTGFVLTTSATGALPRAGSGDFVSAQRPLTGIFSIGCPASGGFSVRSGADPSARA